MGLRSSGRLMATLIDHRSGLDRCVPPKLDAMLRSELKTSWQCCGTPSTLTRKPVDGAGGPTIRGQAGGIRLTLPKDELAAARRVSVGQVCR